MYLDLVPDARKNQAGMGAVSDEAIDLLDYWSSMGADIRFSCKPLAALPLPAVWNGLSETVNEEPGGMMDEQKIWKCPNGHILGLSIRNGSHVRQLLLLRHAVSSPEHLPAEVIATVAGSVMDVSCSICGETRTWVPGQEYIDGLIRKHTRAITFEESEKMFYE